MMEYRRHAKSEVAFLFLFIFLLAPPLWAQSGREAFSKINSLPLSERAAIHNIDFIFGCDYVFQDRFDSSEDYFSGQGRWLPGIVWETNFVADARSFQLLDRSERGAGGQLSHFELSNNTMCAHISQFPVGTYKKAQRRRRAGALPGASLGQ